jgi:hypothetical protein
MMYPWRSPCSHALAGVENSLVSTASVKRQQLGPLAAKPTADAGGVDLAAEPGRSKSSPAKIAVSA